MGFIPLFMPLAALPDWRVSISRLDQLMRHHRKQFIALITVRISLRIRAASACSTVLAKCPGRPAFPDSQPDCDKDRDNYDREAKPGDPGHLAIHSFRVRCWPAWWAYDGDFPSRFVRSASRVLADAAVGTQKKSPKWRAAWPEYRVVIRYVVEDRWNGEDRPPYHRRSRYDGRSKPPACRRSRAADS